MVTFGVKSKRYWMINTMEIDTKAHLSSSLTWESIVRIVEPTRTKTLTPQRRPTKRPTPTLRKCNQFIEKWKAFWVWKKGEKRRGIINKGQHVHFRRRCEFTLSSQYWLHLLFYVTTTTTIIKRRTTDLGRSAFEDGGKVLARPCRSCSCCCQVPVTPNVGLR